MTKGPSIRFEDVRFHYADAAMSFDAMVTGGAITAIIGPSGAGKSTLLNLVAGFERPDSGRVVVGDMDVTDLAPAERPVSMVFQDNNLFTHLEVEQNLLLGYEPARRREQTTVIAIREALERVGLAGYRKRMPGSLSGGERQRVALARVLVRDRPVLLMDEPFAALGPGLRTEMIALIRTLQREKDITLLVVTHQPEDARRMADEILFLRAGAIAGQGPSPQFLDRADIVGLAGYLGQKGT